MKSKISLLVVKVQIKMLETDYFTIVSKPDHIKVECPYCGWEFTDTIDNYLYHELWYNEETTECPECEREFKLVGAEYE